MSESQVTLLLRRQELAQDERGHTVWRIATDEETLPTNRVAIVICDMWDHHWSRGAAERVDAMAPRLNLVVQSARDHGVWVVHAPSETTDSYAGTPARDRMRQLPTVDLPELREHADPPLPIDDSDEGSDTGETSWYKAWTRQHPAIHIDQERDGISADGDEVYRFVQHRQIGRVLIMGVHTNMCVLRRPFAIKALARRGVPVALVRDLTDAMYNPARAPYVSHDEGTRLVVEYIEKFWCPTIDSVSLVTGLVSVE